MVDLVQEEFKKLLEIMRLLRQKCPWDKEQTMKTLIPHSIEEIYELADAVYKDETNNIKEELGDILMHFVFYGIIGEEEKKINFSEIIKGINEKLIFRHPHVFQENKDLKNTQEVLENWQKMKKKEGKEYALQGIPTSLPAITKAIRIQEKASQNNFDFNNHSEAFEKCKEEIKELEKSVEEKSNIEEEFGDVLFSLMNYARFLNIDPELSLQKTNQKFIDRFTIMEKYTQEKKISFKNLSTEEKEKLWEMAKLKLYNKK